MGLNVFLLALFSYIVICQSETYKNYCLQEKDYLDKNCAEERKNFCAQIQCEDVGECDEEEILPDGKLHAIEKNVTVHGCCPACVTYLKFGSQCDPRSALIKCQNGLECEPLTGKCSYPESPLEQKECMIQYYNRVNLRGKVFKHKLRDNEGHESKDDFDFDGLIKYSNEIELPQCDHSTGEFKLKQCRGKKCFCVDPETGEAITGVSEKLIDAANVTCQCAGKLHKKLSVSKQTFFQSQIANMIHYGHINEHCNAAGNYEKLQCIDNICFCVDEQTGETIKDGKFAIYDVLHTLPCFDDEIYRQIGTKDSDAYYQRSCEKQLLKTKRLSYDFYRKGVNIAGLNDIICSYDGRFAPKQYKGNRGLCSDPEGNMITPYAVDKGNNKDSTMNCKCARDEYEVKVNHKAFDVWDCNGFGNYNFFQCKDQDTRCNCIDGDGSVISENIPFDAFNKYLKRNNLIRNDVCEAMADSLNEKLTNK